jgi:hypothetical protein
MEAFIAEKICAHFFYFKNVRLELNFTFVHETMSGENLSKQSAQKGTEGPAHVEVNFFFTG